jgi:hypothetical protein
MFTVSPYPGLKAFCVGFGEQADPVVQPDGDAVSSEAGGDDQVEIVVAINVAGGNRHADVRWDTDRLPLVAGAQPNFDGAPASTRTVPAGSDNEIGLEIAVEISAGEVVARTDYIDQKLPIHVGQRREINVLILSAGGGGCQSRKDENREQPAEWGVDPDGCAGFAEGAQEGYLVQA